jgi:5-formyltetrahydrofolate cyclo-ligase
MVLQVANPEFNRSKKLLRREMRRRMTEETGDSGLVCRALGALLAGWAEVKTIAVFAALPGEVDLSGLVAAHPGRRWVFPRVDGEELHFHEVDAAGCGMVRSAYGILEPRPDSPQVMVAEIDLFLCPGLAFDLRGGRLGRGAGYYDRVLSRARPDARKVGVCFSFQIVEDALMEDHDVWMDQVVCRD